VTLIVTKTKNCISIYDQDKLDRIDFFPTTKTGFEQFFQELGKILLKPKTKKGKKK
jgi:hypothetical protein